MKFIRSRDSEKEQWQRDERWMRRDRKEGIEVNESRKISGGRKSSSWLEDMLANTLFCVVAGTLLIITGILSPFILIYLAARFFMSVCGIVLRPLVPVSVWVGSVLESIGFVIGTAGMLILQAIVIGTLLGVTIGVALGTLALLLGFTWFGNQ